jgi:hypothetical protein
MMGNVNKYVCMYMQCVWTLYVHTGSLENSVYLAIILQFGRLRNGCLIPFRDQNISFLNKPTLRAKKPRIQYIAGGHLPGIKRLKIEAGHIHLM